MDKTSVWFKRLSHHSTTRIKSSPSPHHFQFSISVSIYGSEENLIFLLWKTRDMTKSWCSLAIGLPLHQGGEGHEMLMPVFASSRQSLEDFRRLRKATCQSSSWQAVIILQLWRFWFEGDGKSLMDGQVKSIRYSHDSRSWNQKKKIRNGEEWMLNLE